MGSIPGSGRSPGGENGNLLQYSCLENPMDREALQAIDHGIAELDKTDRLSTHTYTYHQINHFLFIASDVLYSSLTSSHKPLTKLSYSAFFILFQNPQDLDVGLKLLFTIIFNSFQHVHLDFPYKQPHFTSGTILFAVLSDWYISTLYP